MSLRRATLLLTAALVVGGALLAAAPAEAAFPGANGKIAFGRQDTTTFNGEIWAMNPNGTGQTQLTTATVDSTDCCAAWSPDGTKIAFTHFDRASTGTHTDEISVMNPDGSGQTQLTNTTGANEQAPAWSPDGSKSVYMRLGSSINDIWVMNADGTGQAFLTSNGSVPAWSPDGSKIAFQRYIAASNAFEIWVMNADGSGQTQITSFGSIVGPPDWSPDGSKIVFNTCKDAPTYCGSSPSTYDEIYVMNPDGTGLTRLTNNTVVDRNAVWSPDGSKIAFDSTRSGPSEIWVMNADGSGAANLTNESSTNHYQADWQRLPVASYPRPQSASPLSTSLVPLFRQCGTGASPVNGKHSPPLATGSCNPPVPSSAVARVGPGSQSSASLAVVPGDADATNGDQADVAITVHLTDVRTTGGGDYNPNSGGADLTEVTRLRFTDRANNYGGASGTTTDLDFSTPVDCTTIAGPEGASCDGATSADAVVGGAIQESRGTVAQVFRIRLYDSGTNGVRENGGGDDRIFAHQGIYIP